MPRYQLRADHVRPGEHEVPHWHVARVGAVFALCTRLLDPVTPVLPIEEAEYVPVERRCARCWDRAFPDEADGDKVSVMPPAWM
ncbi:hypothetical protein [Streptacidiphilus rugosus]|uniref:hypothetical protein n=1 Tax=Streptacidiphilus rugosus TaxID=405783 RepID=UPI00056D869F|nr:hypothetical protein [Streptacidiphilus rugosus]